MWEVDTVMNLLARDSRQSGNESHPAFSVSDYLNLKKITKVRSYKIAEEPAVYVWVCARGSETLQTGGKGGGNYKTRASWHLGVCVSISDSTISFLCCALFTLKTTLMWNHWGHQHNGCVFVTAFSLTSILFILDMFQKWSGIKCEHGGCTFLLNFFYVCICVWMTCKLKVWQRARTQRTRVLL